jgi:cellulose synthase (UDP-forming)
MSDLFPGLLSYLILLSAVLLVMPLLPWRMPLVRAVAGGAAIFFNARYLYWRTFDTLPAPALSPTFFWAALVYAAEALAIVQVSLHTLLFIRLSDRREEADQYEAALRRSTPLPTVDVFIPTVNEGWDILEHSIQAAIDLDWPNHSIWILDDGGRDWLREQCEDLEIGYFRRDSKKGFKAGNINNALAQTKGDFVLCIDADFVVYPNFLYRTVGFMKDREIALVQTPGNLTNADPVQYNLLGEYAWPEEQRVFTDIVQPARDVWDNAFCYGGSFLVRRTALNAIDGIPEDSITEDLYSSYVLRAKGYKVRYLNEMLSEGLAAESLASFIKQRCRWAMGSLQCLYLPGGPLRAKGLSFLDRLFFLDPIVFYLGYFWPFLILLAPAVYWWTGIPPFNAEVGHLLTMIVPRMAVSMIVMYYLTERKVVPVVSELGRIVGIFYFIPSVLRGLVDPFGHSFHVTLKGEMRDRFTVQWPALRGLIVLGLITVSGMLLNLTRHGFVWLLWDRNTPQVIAFSIFDFWLLFLAALICIERPTSSGTRFERAATSGNFGRAIFALARRIFT